jgi:hypothetical protein
MEQLQEKACVKCGEVKPLELFTRNRYNKVDGRHWECKACVKAYQTANKEKLQAYQKQYQAVYKVEKHDQLLEYTKQWQKDNRDKTKEYQRKSLAKPEVKAKRVEYTKLWNKNNPDKVKASRERALAKKLAQKNDQQ